MISYWTELDRELYDVSIYSNLAQQGATCTDIKKGHHEPSLTLFKDVQPDVKGILRDREWFSQLTILDDGEDVYDDPSAPLKWDVIGMHAALTDEYGIVACCKIEILHQGSSGLRELSADVLDQN